MHHTACLLSLLAVAPACLASDEPEPEVEVAESALNTPDPFPAHVQVSSLNVGNNGLDWGGCFDLPLGGSAPYWLQQFPCNAGDNQRWRFEEVGTNVYRIHSSRNYNLCLDVPDANMQSEQQVQLFPCHDGNNQRWFVEKRTSPRPSARIKPILHLGLCLDVQWGVVRDAAPIWLYTCTNTTTNYAQLFYFRTYQGSVTLSGCNTNVIIGSTANIAPGEVRNVPVASGLIEYKCGLNGSWKQASCPINTTRATIDRRNGGNFPAACFGS